MRIYVASSWRNKRQPLVIDFLREIGHEVYDFRHPCPYDTGFHWSQIGEGWKDWTRDEFRDALQHPLACSGYALDICALKTCDACVLIMPCGRSAHLELGFAVGMGKATAILLETGEPELMYRMVDHLCVCKEELAQVFSAEQFTGGEITG